MDGLPSPVQGRGMLNNYAAFLGMNADRLLLQFAEGLQAQLDARRSLSPEPNVLPCAKTDPQPYSTPPVSRYLDRLALLPFSWAVRLCGGSSGYFAMTSDACPTPNRAVHRRSPAGNAHTQRNPTPSPKSLHPQHRRPSSQPR